MVIEALGKLPNRLDGFLNELGISCRTYMGPKSMANLSFLS